MLTKFFNISILTTKIQHTHTHLYFREWDRRKRFWKEKGFQRRFGRTDNGSMTDRNRALECFTCTHTHTHTHTHTLTHTHQAKSKTSHQIKSQKQNNNPSHSTDCQQQMPWSQKQSTDTKLLICIFHLTIHNWQKHHVFTEKHQKQHTLCGFNGGPKNLYNNNNNNVHLSCAHQCHERSHDIY